LSRMYGFGFVISAAPSPGDQGPETGHLTPVITPAHATSGRAHGTPGT
jgi:hypothetical protein